MQREGLRLATNPRSCLSLSLSPASPLVWSGPRSGRRKSPSGDPRPSTPLQRSPCGESGPGAGSAVASAALEGSRFWPLPIWSVRASVVLRALSDRPHCCARTHELANSRTFPADPANSAADIANSSVAVYSVVQCGDRVRTGCSQTVCPRTVCCTNFSTVCNLSAARS